MKRVLIAIAAVAVTALGVAVAAPVSAAEPTDPVVILIGPSISSECDAATLVIGALPVLQPSLAPAATALLPYLGPVVQLCGSVPHDPSPSVCAFDVPLQTSVANALVAAGVPIPVRFHPVGGAVDQTAVIEGMLPSPFPVGLATALGATLTCTRLAAAPTEPPDRIGPPADATVAARPPDIAVSGATDLSSAGLGDAGGLLGTASGAPSLDGPAPSALASPTVSVRRVHVTYPIAWLLPLVLLGGVVLFGHFLTRDMRDVP